jgi:hypothetical protein
VFVSDLWQFRVSALIPLTLGITSFVLSEVFWLMILLINVWRCLLVSFFSCQISRTISLGTQFSITLLDRHRLLIVMQVGVFSSTVIVQSLFFIVIESISPNSTLTKTTCLIFMPLTTTSRELSFVQRG